MCHGINRRDGELSPTTADGRASSFKNWTLMWSSGTCSGLKLLNFIKETKKHVGRMPELVRETTTLRLPVSEYSSVQVCSASAEGGRAGGSAQWG